MRYVVFETRMGWVGILAGEKGLIRTTLPHSSREQALSELGEEINSASFSQDFFDDIVRRLRRYFNGEEVTFSDALDLSFATRFQRAVWRITSLIPYGEVRSYRWVAEGLGDRRAARAAGQALGRNPFPIIIPCHRVLGSNGNLGGFGGGLEMKRALLRLENPGYFTS